VQISPETLIVQKPRRLLRNVLESCFWTAVHFFDCRLSGHAAARFVYTAAFIAGNFIRDKMLPGDLLGERRFSRIPNLQRSFCFTPNK